MVCGFAIQLLTGLFLFVQLDLFEWTVFVYLRVSYVGDVADFIDGCEGLWKFKITNYLDKEKN